MPLPDVLLLAAAVYGLNVSGAAAQYLYCTGIDTHGHLTFSSVQPGQVGPGGSSTLTANSAGTLWTSTETSGIAGPWTNATLFGQYNDGGSPPTSCGVTIGRPRLCNDSNPQRSRKWTRMATRCARDETDAALLSQSYATTTGVKASNLPGDYFNNTEQSELASAAAISPPRGRRSPRPWPPTSWRRRRTSWQRTPAATSSWSRRSRASWPRPRPRHAGPNSQCQRFYGKLSGGRAGKCAIGSPDASSTIGVGTISDGHITAYQFGAFENPDGSPISITVNDQNGNPISLAGKTLEMVVYGLVRADGRIVDLVDERRPEHRGRFAKCHPAQRRRDS